jgi:hypothetical protein
MAPKVKGVKTQKNKSLNPTKASSQTLKQFLLSVPLLLESKDDF